MIESLYIHIPFCLSKCLYCDFFSLPLDTFAPDSSSFVDEYCRALKNEIIFNIEEKQVKELKTVYIGGGTPSLLNKNQIEIIFSAFKNLLNENSEVTLEANSKDISKEFLSMVNSLGVNRLSVGFQSFNDESLKFVKRRSSRKENLKALEILDSYWKGKISCDLISALPLETEESFLEGLEIISESKVSHLSLYSLTFEEGSELTRAFNEKKLDYDFDQADEMWIRGKDFLASKGFTQYEVSNFYRGSPDNQCRHNLSYWNLDSYLGCGAGAAATFYEKKLRFSNKNSPHKYVDFWLGKDSKMKKSDICEREELSEETLIFEFFMMGLRKKCGVCENDFKKKFFRPYPEKIKLVMENWLERKLAFFYQKEGVEFYCLNEKGFLFLNRFLEEIL